MPSLDRLAPLFALGCSLTLAACAADKPDDTTKGDSGGDTNNDTGSDEGGFWAVGAGGKMIRLDHDGEAAFYPLELSDDLRAIACKGRDQAVVAGAAGVVLTTLDAGQSWDRVAVDPGLELRAVALSAGYTGYIVGDGVVLRSQDDSRTWTPLAVEAHDWTAVSTTAIGKTALLTTAGGQIFRLQDDALTQVHAGDGALLTGVAITPDGRHAVAVGHTGALLRSDDGGLTWSAELPATSRDLLAVRIAADASQVVAVGEAGTVVRIADDDTAVTQLLDPALSLRALHLGSGHGHAVGDDGVVFVTHDAGRSWEPVSVDLDVDLLGLDDLHGEPHL